MTWTVEDVIDATGGQTVMPLATRLSAVCTDTRNILPSSLFVALHGDTHDGHRFVGAALDQGALVALVDADTKESRTIRVRDTLRALGDLAAWARRRMDARVVGLTGSAGKTTTKELIASVCAQADGVGSQRVHKTEGNFNNLIGLPLTVLQARGDEAVLVLEMGMNRPGEIARLTEIADPDFALITNVGLAHLEGVGGTIAGVAAAKGELFVGVRADTTLLVNLDDPWVRRLAEGFAGRSIGYGDGGIVQAHGVADRGIDGLSFDLWIDGEVLRVHSPLVGAHNVTNALAAAAVGHAMGIRIGAIGRGIEQVAGVLMRMQVLRLKNGVTVINDAYNANPSSVEAALQTLRQCPGRAVVVFGEMKELGVESERAHRIVGERAAALGIHRLLLLGEATRATAAAACAAGMTPAQVYQGVDHADVAAELMRHWRASDTFLVKGSHSMHMEEVVRLLEAAGNQT